MLQLVIHLPPAVMNARYFDVPFLHWKLSDLIKLGDDGSSLQSFQRPTPAFWLAATHAVTVGDTFRWCCDVKGCTVRGCGNTGSKQNTKRRLQQHVAVPS